MRSTDSRQLSLASAGGSAALVSEYTRQSCSGAPTLLMQKDEKARTEGHGGHGVAEMRPTMLRRPHKSGEVFAITPNQEKRQRRDHSGHSQASRRHEDVKGKDVNDDRPEQRQAQRRPASREQQKAACELSSSDN